MLALVACSGCVTRRPATVVAALGVPAVPREFRGVWVATLANIDWPSKPGLSSQEQQKELLGILDTAVTLNLNAVVLQVRPAGDALYDSKLEPWSHYLTGTQGRAPEPYYDPLAFAVEEAHRRGLELHAWFNPYRVGTGSRKSPPARNHLSQTRPDLVRDYGRLLWLDPGEPDVQHHTLAVILDVVRRYDVDGIHLDDYFYPYPQRDNTGKVIEFPDDASWERYARKGGTLSRADWRRRNVNLFVERLYSAVKQAKPSVKVGISPSGIWQPGYPSHIKGMNPYKSIYADSRLWLHRGWCDYFSPQLYWPIEKPEQSFVSLLEWWGEQNPRLRHLWPGLYTSRTADGTASAFDDNEIPYQVRWSRVLEPEDSGHLHFSAQALVENKAGIADKLAHEVYAAPALVPASWWLPGPPPRRPQARITSTTGDRLTVEVTPASLGQARLWVVQAQRAGEWAYAIVPAARASHALTLPGGGGPVQAVYVFAIDRNGNAGPAIKLAPSP